MNTVRDSVVNELWDWVWDKTNELCEYAYMIDIVDATDIPVNDIMFDPRHLTIWTLNETSTFHT
jgi:hypothetical protein